MVKIARGGAIGVLAALPLALWMWGFTVDDALISIRYARHLADGAGYRFNVGEASTDGVTPLPWAFILAPLSHADAMTVLLRAKCVGLGAWLGAAAAWGVAVSRAPASAWVKALAMAALALSVPVAANAVSGMETAVAMALATCAAIASTARGAALLAGLATALRPEMAAWALVLAMVRAIGSRNDDAAKRPWSSRVAPIALALGPFVFCAVVRVVVFGRAAPLSVLAKPSDLAHGFAYVGAAAFVSLAPIAAVAPLALRRATPQAVAIALASVAHLFAVIAVGGDWMPYARLLAPIVPALLYAFVVVSPHARAWSNAIRGGLAVAVGVALIARGGTSGRSIGADRARLVELARPELANARRVASLDIGWVSAATDASIVDLAGVTDPSIAVLPGGHTSKRVDPEMILERDPDSLLFYGFRDHAGHVLYTRVVEARLARSELIVDRYEATAWLPLGSSGAGYMLFRRLPR